MANTYTKIYVQIVFAVKFRDAVITSQIREPLQKYMTGIIQNRKHLMLAIYAMPDHLHILVAVNPDQSISDLVRDVKSNSAKFINESKKLKSRFQWQTGFAAFSYAEAELENVKHYIFNQEEHHRKRSFQEEYLRFLKEYDIEHNPKYLFQSLE